jgi:hypothetical protein
VVLTSRCLEEFLNGADVVPVLEQMGGEGVTQGVGRGALRDPDPSHCPFDHALEDGLVQVVLMPLAGVPVHIKTRRWEDPLPHPFPPRVRILPPERGREFDPPGSVLKVAAVLFANGLVDAGPDPA